MPKLKREHRAIDESCSVAGNKLLSFSLPFHLRSAKCRAIVLRCSLFRSSLQICGKSYVESIPKQSVETLARSQLIVPPRQVPVE